MGLKLGISLGSIGTNLTVHNATQAIPILTNAEKLSLPAGTTVGTRVRITDGFKVIDSGEDGCNGFWYPVGLSNGKQSYKIAGNTHSICIWIPETGWLMTDIQDDTKYESLEDVEFPWLVETWNETSGALPVPRISNPVVQALQSPSSAQGGVFVSTGFNAETFIGIHTISGTLNGRSVFSLLGSDGSVYFQWSGTRWELYDDNADGLARYSLSNVATPDLASNWKDASDDSSASLTVSSVTQGELDAGVTVSGGSAGEAGVLLASTSPGIPFNSYSGAFNGGTGSIATEGFDDWIMSSSFAAPVLHPFPWQEDWSSNSPAPTVARNNVASEANWSNV